MTDANRAKRRYKEIIVAVFGFRDAPWMTRKIRAKEPRYR